ncbi:methyltransferase domain-containing protein [Myxococcus sp. K15C18031901]|nr:methyltransferase [Myxococcus dinghuensis]MCP3098540.1 methyltransferase domain-containing protein [Myxococcus dinghuensis]
MLATLLKAEQRRGDATLDVLEFGCGFGRLAGPVAALPGVRYHGYDVSVSMTEPLRQEPPPSVSPVAERIFHGDSPRKVLAGRSFDCVFSVSALGYTPSGRITGLMEELGDLVRPGGSLILLENPLVPVSLWDFSSRPGRWLHPFASLLPEGWDLHHASEPVSGQDLYLLKRNAEGGRRYFQVGNLEDARSESQPLGLQTLHESAFLRLLDWSEKASEQLSRPEDARIAELSQQLSTEAERLARRQRLRSLSDDLARFRAPRMSPPEVKPLSTPSKALPAVVTDAALDTRWAHESARFNGVLHLFHQDWHGIRAAAGYFPGRKMAIPSERTLERHDLLAALAYVEKSLCHTVIVHAFSPTAHQVVEALRKALGSSIRLLALWHGSTAQFPNPIEIDYFGQLVELQRRGILNAVATVKPGMHLLAEEVFPKTVLNVPPRMSEAERGRPPSRPTREAFIPIPNDWRKNFYTNLFAGHASSRLDTLHVTATYLMPEALRGPKRVVSVPRPDRATMFDLVRRCDIVLNASLSECQPMTALEGLVLRVPCLHGPLALGALDAHPYQKLTQMVHVDSVERVRDAIDQVLELRERSPAELTGMMMDYERVLTQEAFRVLEEFVQS